MNPTNHEVGVEMTATEIMEAHFELGDLMDSFKPGILYGLATPCINVSFQRYIKLKRQNVGLLGDGILIQVTLL